MTRTSARLPQDALRMIVGFTIIASHIASFAMILLLGYMEIDERIDLALMISPVFAVYVTAIVKSIMAMQEFDRTPVHPAVSILSIGAAIVFAVAIPLVIHQFQIGAIESFDQLKKVTGVIETTLGLYTGAIIDRLFARPAS